MLDRTLRWLVVFCLSLVAVIRGDAADTAFSIRGYYMTFMRMPTMGLPEWKQAVDCLQRDGGNTLLLWTGGAFRSKKFPITWQYNREHKNVEKDFVGDLIDYAHGKRIKVLLCLTPFAYDGVNQYPIEHSELKATQKNGQPAQYWGMHSWGYNLCPSKPDSQRFMLEYAREMVFDFYPKADGLMLESSDYAICHCADCRERFFEKEFQFVEKISQEVWKAKPGAMIAVYPHYFSGRKVPGFDVTGAKQKFDPRWTLFFTPHSAHIDPDLLREAKSSIYWNEGLTLGTPEKIRDSARTAKSHNLTGYVPSLEPFSCPSGPPKNPGLRLKPFHFEWLSDGQMPLNELLIRVNRIAYREFSRNPELSAAEFRRVLGKEIFGPAATMQSITDLLYMQESWFTGADWFTPTLLLTPARVKERAAKERWPADRLNGYRTRVERLREIVRRYGASTNNAERELHRIASLMVNKWDAAKVFGAE